MRKDIVRVTRSQRGCLYRGENDFIRPCPACHFRRRSVRPTGIHDLETLLGYNYYHYRTTRRIVLEYEEHDSVLL